MFKRIALTTFIAIVSIGAAPGTMPCNSSLPGIAQSGCCSWHGGVCGCSLGTKVCCDGSYSPSCKC